MSHVTILDQPDRLETLYQHDPLAAVRLAIKWAHPDTIITEAHFEAAYNLMQRQTHFPLCLNCKWPVIDDQPHSFCQAQINYDRGLPSYSVKYRS
jgi:hypothetical protein